MLTIVFLFAISIIMFVLYKKILIKNIYLNSLFKYVSVSLFVACFLEITIFNFRHYESLFFSKDKTELSISNTSGLECNDVCEIKEEEAYIEILDIDKKASNIYIDIDSNDLITYGELFITDEGAGVYYSVGEINCLSDILRSKYYKLNASGKIKNIKIQFTDELKYIKVNKIKINVVVPFFINLARIVIVFLLLFLIQFTYHTSVFHKISFDNKITKRIVLVIITCILSISLFLSSCNYLSNKYEIPLYNQYQYQTLTEALLKGHVYLDLPVSEELKNMNNPYDTLLREDEAYKKSLWDYSYYKGKYYSYFGIVPCLLLYLPYKVITGSHLRNFIALSVTIAFFSFSIFYFYYQLCKKYFKNLSMPYYLLFCLFTIFASGIIFALAEAGFYPIPIIMALGFANVGIACWMKYTMVEKNKLLYIFLGSLFISLIAGCRPQLLLSCAFSIPYFFLEFKKKITIRKHSIKELIVFFLPVIVIAALIMTYNYVRFDSVFDFGANYNLTTNDMTHRGIKLDRTLLGFYSFLFQPNRIIAEFPFLEPFNITTVYKGVNVFEGMHGGFFFINIICLCSIIPSLIKEYVKEKELRIVHCLSLIVVAIIIFADTQMAGILGRYFLDFSWLILLSTNIVLLSLLNKYGKKVLFCKFLLFMIVLSMLMNCLTYFTSYYLFIFNPVWKYTFYYIFMFWV